MNSASAPHPVQLAAFQAVRSRIEDWRRSRTCLGPMPDALWKEAARLAHVHGINPVARCLRLAYYDLKKRVVAMTPSEKPVPRPSFVEVAAHSSPEGRDILFEMERPDGACLRVRFSGPDAVIALAQEFLRTRA